MRTSSQKSAQARAAPAPAATAPRAPQIAPARPVTSAARIRLMRSIRASTTVSRFLVARIRILFCRSALVRLRHAHQRLDGGAETEEEAEVHDPVCVELAIQKVAGAPADHEIQGDLDSQRPGHSRRAPHLFAIRVDGAAFV